MVSKRIPNVGKDVAQKIGKLVWVSATEPVWGSVDDLGNGSS
jgi:hypothetical protein